MWLVSVPAVASAPNREPLEAARRRGPLDRDAVHASPWWPLAQGGEQPLELGPLSLCEAMDRAVGCIGDPTREVEARCHPQHEVAKADALDPSEDADL